MSCSCNIQIRTLLWIRARSANEAAVSGNVELQSQLPFLNVTLVKDVAIGKENNESNSRCEKHFKHASNAGAFNHQHPPFNLFRSPMNLTYVVGSTGCNEVVLDVLLVKHVCLWKEDQVSYNSTSETALMRIY